MSKSSSRLTESTSNGVGFVGGMHFNCKAAGAHVLVPLVDATLVLQCGKFGIPKESSRQRWRRSKKLAIAVEWISSECIDICWLTLV